MELMTSGEFASVSGLSRKARSSGKNIRQPDARPAEPRRRARRRAPYRCAAASVVPVRGGSGREPGAASAGLAASVALTPGNCSDDSHGPRILP